DGSLEITVTAPRHSRPCCVAWSASPTDRVLADDRAEQACLLECFLRRNLARLPATHWRGGLRPPLCPVRSQPHARCGRCPARRSRCSPCAAAGHARPPCAARHGCRGPTPRPAVPRAKTP